MALLSGQLTYREMEAKWGVSPAALSRHKKNHLPEKLAKAQEAEEVAEADRLLNRIDSLAKVAIKILMDAEEAGDRRTALRGVREARQCLKVLAELTGQIEGQRIEQTVNIVFAESLEPVILEALRPYPAARKALVAALEEVVDDEKPR